MTDPAALPEPMSDERLAEIRSRADALTDYATALRDVGLGIDDRAKRKATLAQADRQDEDAIRFLECLAELRRLRAALADARAIGAAVDQYDAETALVPIGAENRSKGGSVYNWRRTVVDEIRKKAEALRAAPQAPGVRVPVWQPIETAPKDGSKFWGLIDEDAIAMFWHAGFGEFVSSYSQMSLAPGYTFEDGSTTQDHHPVIHHPKLWMPMTNHPAGGA